MNIDVTKLPKDVQAVMLAMQQENERLTKQNEAQAAKLASKTKITFKVSEKGCCSVYGLQRWPISLYKTQWEALLGKVDDLKAFLADNADKLAVKSAD